MHKDYKIIDNVQIQQFEGWNEYHSSGCTRGIVYLKNYDHFIKISNEFDAIFDTKTYILQASIYDVLHTICKMDLSKNNIFNKKMSLEIDECVNNLFENIEEFNIAQFGTDLKKSRYIAYLNRIGTLIKNIKENEDIKFPMCLHHTKTYTGVHPGGARTFMAGIYSKPVTFIVTDYTKSIAKKFKMFNFFDLSEKKINIDENCYLLIGKLWKETNNVMKNKDGLCFGQWNNGVFIDGK